ncbi:MAG TPA: glycosyltransferase family 4 protein [Clostridia bacterium]|nr:glycosyltransferase family 4 protein [Clostridia bacterium]
MKSLRICMIFSTPFPPREGIGNYVCNLSQKLVLKGHKVTLITRGSLNFKEEKYEEINILKPTFLPFYPFHVHFHRIFVNRLIKKFESNFDIIHIHSPLSPVISTKIPIISTIHTPMKTDTLNFESVGIFSYAAKAQSKVSYKLEQDLLAKSKIITTVSSTVANELVNEYGINYNDINIIYNGVNEEVFVPLDKKSSEKYILYVGSLAYRKGLFDLIDCAKYVCTNYADIKFVVLGDGVLKDRLKKKVKELNLEDRVLFKGHVSKRDLISYYQNALIHVIPSHYEGLPTVLLEAMSCGLAVVATAVSGNIDVISSEDNGILVPSKSPVEMAEKISFLIENNDFREALGMNARKTIEEHFTWDIISNNILSYYESLMGEKSG